MGGGRGGGNLVQQAESRERLARTRVLRMRLEHSSDSDDSEFTSGQDSKEDAHPGSLGLFRNLAASNAIPSLTIARTSARAPFSTKGNSARSKANSDSPTVAATNAGKDGLLFATSTPARTALREVEPAKYGRHTDGDDVALRARKDREEERWSDESESEGGLTQSEGPFWHGGRGLLGAASNLCAGSLAFETQVGFLAGLPVGIRRSPPNHGLAPLPLHFYL
jgi:hypothetical protein